MWLRSFFHKIKMFFVRSGEETIPLVSAAKRYGNYGEDEFTDSLREEMPDCKIKRNVIISTSEGNAEIDCLVLYKNKLFAIEVKTWKGRLTENGDEFIQEKTDRWTDEVHTKIMRSPFRQIGRAIHLLRMQNPVNAWVNPIVFFDNGEDDEITVYSDNVWFEDIKLMADYIKNSGRTSAGDNAAVFFDRCIPADCLYEDKHGRTLHCVIDRESLVFSTDDGYVSGENILTIRVCHHWYYDDIIFTLKDGTEKSVACENAYIMVDDNGEIDRYAFCKLDEIILGRTVSR